MWLLGHFFVVKLFRFLQDIGPTATIEKIKKGCVGLTSQWL